MDSKAPDLDTASYSWPPADEAILGALEAAYRDGSWGQYHGQHCDGLISDLEHQFAVQYAMLCSSGTVGIELALRGCGVESGDEVVLAGYDFPGNFRAIEAIGALPVLVDIDPKSWCLDANELGSVVSENVKAIVVSHLHGGLAEMPKITEIARQRGWHIVEDACQQPGAQLASQPVGSWGDVSILSFGGSKLLTAGRGGAVLTNDAQILQRIKIFADRGNQAFPLSELQAAVLRPQLRKLDERNRIRSENIVIVRQATAPISEWLRPVEQMATSRPSFYKFAWSFVPAEEKPELRDDLLSEIIAARLPIGPGFSWLCWSQRATL